MLAYAKVDVVISHAVFQRRDYHDGASTQKRVSDSSLSKYYYDQFSETSWEMSTLPAKKGCNSSEKKDIISPPSMGEERNRGF